MSIAVVEGPIRELLLEIPDSEKHGLYYSVVSLFVVSTVVATILTLSFLVLSILLWRNFKSMRFFWFLTQLTTSAFIISASNLFINIPAALSLFSKEVTQSQLFFFLILLIFVIILYFFRIW
ncbi:G_PROTEIN_RECEP_F1_2 domain-containing protein [Caenorhabditis elegans]|uniref:G_PROTEIN_RECEP_F1_2 domain-containing protein n=1 Tax=Caenorhabditis elegans TaxID=6239 RepID=O44176_CAEEL|nr:G_PROTEIN_RECEP_F1_2 domain-containing protein [Caenorhabditis elegans]CCD63485.2 G_PROTEIN_RECEP_F1_2 domain-containing protein [Caenorhabditis elegans]|eukprot:NP_500068.3 Uncharacterized protein CELE_F58F6.5 [Caenorhabditis elegans]